MDNHRTHRLRFGAAWRWTIIGPTAVVTSILMGQAVPTAVPSDQTKTAGQADEEPQPVPSTEVRVSEYMTVDIVVQNDTITNVLQKLAIQARRNIIPSPSVSQVINATIYGVPFYEALDGLLRPNGLGYIERGDFIYVYTAAELASLQTEQRQCITRIIHLDYLRASDARDFVLSLLSTDGTIVATRDLSGGGEGGGAGGGQDESPGASVGSDEDSVYTPEVDEYALANAIVVHDYPENVRAVEVFLAELDTRPAQVLIEATIIQTTLSEANAFGVDFALLSGVQFTEFFNFPEAYNPINFRATTGEDSENIRSAANDNFVTFTPGNTGLGPATVRAGIIDDDVGVFIRALDEVTDVTLLSNPKILALNRQRAKVLVGTRVGYLETTVVENQVLQTVQFIDTGIALDIRPFILRDGRIRLELAPKVSQVVFREFESAEGVTQQIPDEQIQTVNTDVLVPAGYTAVLGGLFREDTSRTRSQVPVLGDIPLLGTAFRGHDDAIDQVEIIFMIKPTVLRDQILIDQGERGIEYGERIRVGSRLGLLPWSRERQSSQLNLAAERLLDQGQHQKALWKLRRSLELHPQQSEAIRIYEQLISEPQWWPTRSHLQRVIDEQFHHELDVPPPLAEEPSPTIAESRRETAAPPALKASADRPETADAGFAPPPLAVPRQDLEQPAGPDEDEENQAPPQRPSPDDQSHT